MESEIFNFGELQYLITEVLGYATITVRCISVIEKLEKF